MEEPFQRLTSDEPALVERCADEAGEERVRLERTALELRMELDADEPWMVRPLDDFRQAIVGAHAGEEQAASLECLAIVDVDLVAVAMALADFGRAVCGGHAAVAGKD